MSFHIQFVLSFASHNGIYKNFKISCQNMKKELFYSNKAVDKFVYTHVFIFRMK